MAWNVLILGGGFGGLYAARKLGDRPELEMPVAGEAAETVAR